MSALRDALQRRRQDLNPLTTTLSPFPPAQNQFSAQTPHSGVSPFGYSATNYSSHSATPQSAVPLGAVRSYNPQQWSSPNSVSSQDVHLGGGGITTQYATAQQGDEESAPAPPPYSPPRSRNRVGSTVTSPEEPPSAIITRGSPAVDHRSSPHITSASPQGVATPFPSVIEQRTQSTNSSSATFFPPPPSGRERASSRDRPNHLFNLPTFVRKPATTTPVSPENSRLSPGIPRAEAFTGQTSTFASRTIVRPPPISVDIAPQRREIIRDESVGDDAAFSVRPPASRRAASAGAIQSSSSSNGYSSRGSSTNRWEPGMPLPPPPPGPPPQSQSRSQSMSRASEPVASPPTRRPPQNASMGISTLGPIPPTPAGWVDEDISNRGKSPNRGLTIDTSAGSVSTQNSDSVNSGSSSSGLARTHAVRGEPKSIRERRSESRSGRAMTATKSEPSEEPSNNPWAEAITPSDIMVPMTVLGRRPPVAKNTPRSARSLQNMDTPNSSKSIGAIGGQSERTPTAVSTFDRQDGMRESRGSTPRPLGSATLPSSGRRLEAPTPPFSPGGNDVNRDSPMIPPKSLPTPPPTTTQSQTSQSRSRRESSESQSSRPAHRPFHAAADGTETSNTSLQSRPTSQQSSSSFMSPSFAQEAINRHMAFIQRESAAISDEERVRLFADFIVSESRLRRDTYASAIDAMGSEILELTRDLFRPLTNTRPPMASQPKPTYTHPHSRQSSRSDRAQARGTSSSRELPQLQTSESNTSRPSPSSSGPSPGQNRPDSGYYNSYKPSLSPIASLAAGSGRSGPDESDSRGRPSSRWWEVGSAPSSPAMKVERSKRESKYMGVSTGKDFLWEDGRDTPRETISSGEAGPSSQPFYGENEYPPEKVGFHEIEPQESSANTGHIHTSILLYSPSQIQPYTPTPQGQLNTRKKANLLDVSRLVTLPPPYPRHHPAVNNAHPDLTSIRTSVRSLSDQHPLVSARARFVVEDTAAKDKSTREIAQRRQNLRANIARSIAAGEMTYADAAAVEVSSEVAEGEATKAAMKASFDLFQSSVITPLNDLLQQRIIRATQLFDLLKSQLGLEAQEQAAVGAELEEGDEKPELLEKLTLLKWIFEAREALYKEVFDLLSDRNQRYAIMATEPYRIAKNDAKVANAERFFAADARKRALEAARESFTRTKEFMDIVESNVVRGVEVHLSAFWDIVPGISKVLEAIPKDLEAALASQKSSSQPYDGQVNPRMRSDSGELSRIHEKGQADWGILIPPEEYAENPSYERWPLQYLFSLLEHCSLSTYQFIESQTNLLCLLHEVKSAVAAAKARSEDATFEVEYAADTSGGIGLSKEENDVGLRLERANEERRLTEDLKEKVRCVEELWTSAIGDEFGSVKERVKEFLMQDGGWEGVFDAD